MLNVILNSFNSVKLTCSNLSILFNFSLLLKSKTSNFSNFTLSNTFIFERSFYLKSNTFNFLKFTFSNASILFDNLLELKSNISKFSKFTFSNTVISSNLL